MAEEIGFENGRNSNFQGLVTLTLDPVIWHTVVYHSSTSTYIPNFIQIKETFCGRTDVRTYRHFSPSNIIRSTFGLLEVDLINKKSHKKLYFTPLPRSPPWTDFYQSWNKHSSHGRNQSWQIVCQSVQGFWFYRGSKFPFFSHRKLTSPL